MPLVNNPRITRFPREEHSWIAFLKELQQQVIQMSGSGGPRILLTNSTSGRPIKLVNVANPGDNIHAAIATPGQFDEIHLWATNTTAANKTVTVQWGGVTAVNDEFVSALVLLPNTTTKVVDGLILNNAAVKAYASVTNTVLITGYAIRLVSTG